MNLVISDEKYAKSLFPLQANNDIIILKQLKRSRFECSCLSLKNSNPHSKIIFEESIF